MASTTSVLPDLFPQPKVLEIRKEMSDLALDVRLVTSNVLPLQRKAIRSVLTAAGVRVVANKKKYVVDVRVESSETFSLADVPENVRGDYYEVELHGSEVVIRAPEQEGTVWGVQTVAALFRAFRKGVQLPDLKIRDWPMLPHRGVLLKNDAFAERMTLAEWMTLLDMLSAMKLNFIGVELFGNAPLDCLNLAVPGHEDWRTMRRVDWYSAVTDMYGTEEYAPFLREKEELFAAVAMYGAEKGVPLMPVMDVLAGSHYLSTKMTAYAAKGKNGRSLGEGVCFSSKEGRAFLEGMLQETLATVFPGGVNAVCLLWNSEAAVPCKCKNCAGKKTLELAEDYFLWLISMLLEHGVRHIVIGNDGTLSADLRKKLAKRGLSGKVTMLFARGAAGKVNSGKANAGAIWLEEEEGYALDSEKRLECVEQLMQDVEKGKALGAAEAIQFRPLHLEASALLADSAWGTGKKREKGEVVERWRRYQFGEYAEKLAKVLPELTDIPLIPAYRLCLPQEGGEAGYPGIALDVLEKNRKAGKELTDALTRGKALLAAMDALLEQPDLPEAVKGDFQLLQSEAALICAVSSVFLCMMAVRKELQGGNAGKRLAVLVGEERVKLRKYLMTVERGAPLWLSPCQLHRGALLYRFLDQLESDLKEASSKKAKKAIRWSL